MTTYDKFKRTIADGDYLSDGYFNGLTAMVPIGAVIPWLKTFISVDSGTTDGTTANKLVQSGQNFLTTVEIGYCVHNTTDDTFAYVTAVDSDTTLSIDSDIMVSGENFTIYKTPALSDGWVECDGSAISDSDSIFNGDNAPDLNSGSNRFLRGNIYSGSTGGSTTHNHLPSVAGTNMNGDNAGGDPKTENHLPPYYDVVWILRIK